MLSRSVVSDSSRPHGLQPGAVGTTWFFSRVAAAFSSYDGDLSLPLGLALAHTHTHYAYTLAAGAHSSSAVITQGVLDHTKGQSPQSPSTLPGGKAEITGVGARSRAVSQGWMGGPNKERLELRQTAL